MKAMNHPMRGVLTLALALLLAAACQKQPEGDAATGGGYSGDDDSRFDAKIKSNGDNDGNRDNVHSPGKAHDKFGNSKDQKYHKGEHLRCNMGCRCVNDIIEEADSIAAGGKHIRHYHQHHWEKHVLDAGDDQIKKFHLIHQALEYVEEEAENQGDDDAGLHVDIGENRRSDQNDNRSKEIDKFRVFNFFAFHCAANVDFF